MQMSEVIANTVKHAQQEGKTLFFKGTHMDNDTAKVLVDAGTYSVVGWRDNVLDVAECYVRDCFEDGLGRAIDEQGEESHLCIHRRQAPKNETEGIKVEFNIPHLLRFVKHVSARKGKKNMQLEEAGFASSVPTVSMEKLVGYEFSKEPEALTASVRSWEEILQAWGIQADTHKILKILRPNVGKLVNKSHKDTLSNYAAVRDAMTEAGYGWMVRGN
jgi:hypothetical protein